jgi:hypothetical protein
MKNDTELIVGCLNGNLLKFSLTIPTSPELVSTIKLSHSIETLFQFSEDKVLCGHENGLLRIIGIKKFKSLAKVLL